MADLDAFLTDPHAITERLTELSRDCHLVSPSTNVDAPLPEGWAVSFSFVTVDPSSKSSDVIRDYEKNGRVVLSAKKLQEIGAAAGISWNPESGRRGDESNPHMVQYQAIAVLKNFDGTERDVLGEVLIDLRDGSDATNTVLHQAVDAGKDPFLELRHRRAHLLAEAETRAQARAVSNGLGLVRDYEPTELAKPFAVARLVWTGRSEDPVTKEAFAKITADRALGADRVLFPPRVDMEILKEVSEKIQRAGELRYEQVFGVPFPHAWVKGEPAIRRIALVADTHADGEEGGRLDEHDEIMHWIAGDAAERECTGFVHHGDVFERASTPRERLAVATWVRLWCEFGRLIIITGNHDEERDIELLGRLRTRHEVTAVTRPGVYHLMQDHGPSTAVACLPWPRKAALLAALGDASRREGDQAATHALRDVLRGLGDELQGHTGPRLFAGHLMMRGSKSGLGQPPLTGCDYELGLEDLALVRASFYGLGHIHAGQGWDVMGAPAAYISSPRRQDFGELDPKGYVVVEFDGSKLRGWERVPTPCAPMLHLSAKWTPSGLDGGEDEGVSVRGADVRLRYSVPVAEQEVARAHALELRDRLLGEGARTVQLEAIATTERRSRAPEVAAARTLPDRVERHWEARGFDPADRRAPLLEKVAGLEVESAA